MAPLNSSPYTTEQGMTVDGLAALYGDRMRAVRASEDLQRRVTELAKGPRSSASTAPVRRHRARLLAFALAACLALMAGIGMWATVDGATTVDKPLSFALKAYGSDEKTLLPDDARGSVVLDSATKSPDYGALSEESYAVQGLFTGCEFHVEGEGITRIQAHVDRGEVYQVETVSYTPSSEPAIAQALGGWKPELRFYDELTARYDLVEEVLYDKSIAAANEERIKGDPDTLLKSNLYQRLGDTVDLGAAELEASRSIDGSPIPLTERTFGLWTNLPFDALTYEEALAQGQDLTVLADRNREAALETLDGALLTVTVTFADGSCATQTIELHTADFKAHVIARVNGGPVTETSSTMLAGTAAELPRPDASSVVGNEVSVRTVYGTVVSETDERFPYGAATRTEYDEPRTPVEFVYESAAASDPETRLRNEQQRLRDAPWSPLAREDLLEGTASYRTSVHHTDNNAVSDSGIVTIEGAEVVSGLPDEVEALTDLFAYYANGGIYDTSLDSISDERQGYAIAADGSLTPGYSYVVVTETIRNDGFHPAEVALCSGMFYAVEEDPADPDALRMKMLSTEEGPIWRSGHDGPGWDAHFLFQALEPGEERTVRLLYVLPDDILRDERLGFYYHDPELAPRERVLHLGALLS